MSRLPDWARHVARPILPGWPDAGRRIVQTPALNAFLREAVRDGRVERVLNAGCGEGLYAPLLIETCGPSLQVEMDLSATGARHLWSSRQRYVCASLTRVPLQSASVDLVLCSEVLEHVRDDRSGISELARVLRPGGWLIMSVPTPPAVPDPAHVREGYTREQLDALLDAHGLESRRWRTCMGVFFRSVLRWWRPNRVPRGAIVGLAWMDRLLTLGPPMDLVVLARKR